MINLKKTKKKKLTCAGLWALQPRVIRIWSTFPEPIAAASATTAFAGILEGSAFTCRTACNCDGWRCGRCINTNCVFQILYWVSWDASTPSMDLGLAHVEKVKPEMHSTLSARNRKSDKDNVFGKHLHSQHSWAGHKIFNTNRKIQYQVKNLSRQAGTKVRTDAQMRVYKSDYWYT